MAITLSGTTFTAMNKWMHDGYELITFTAASPEVKELAAYKSKSDMGFWRLLSTYSNGKKYYKGRGEDYIQQTLIHLELQKYFNHVLPSLPALSTDEYKKYDPVAGGSEVEDKRDEIEMSLEVVRDEQSRNRLLAALAACEADLIRENEALKTARATKAEIDNEDRMEKIEPFYSYSKHEENRCSSANPKRDENLLDFANTLKPLFPSVGNPELIYKEYVFNDIYREAGKEDTIDCKADIYRVKLVGSKELLLHFMVYSLKTGGTSEELLDIKNKIAPVCLTTSDECTSFGVYAHYVLAGNYICKILDYTGLQTLPKNKKCTHYYSYIGHMYENVFPYTEPQIQQVAARRQIGARRRFFTSRCKDYSSPARDARTPFRRGRRAGRSRRGRGPARGQ